MTNRRAAARPEVVGHGGAGDFFPGNSRPAIEQALLLGVDRVEVDVQRSGDARLLLLHNETVVDQHGRRLAVRATMTSDLRELVDGLLTLSEAFDILGPDMPSIIDVKAPGFEDLLVAEFGSLAPDRDVIVTTTYAQSIRTLKRALPNLRFGLSSGHIATAWHNGIYRSVTSAVLRHILPRPLIGCARLCGATEIMIQHHVCSETLVHRCHAAGLGVYAWTVDRPAQIDRVIRFGVDGIISNRPDLVRKRIAIAAGGVAKL